MDNLARWPLKKNSELKTRMNSELKSEWLWPSYMVKIVTEVWTFSAVLGQKLVVFRKQIWPAKPYGFLT